MFDKKRIAHCSSQHWWILLRYKDITWKCHRHVEFFYSTWKDATRVSVSCCVQVLSGIISCDWRPPTALQRPTELLGIASWAPTRCPYISCSLCALSLGVLTGCVYILTDIDRQKSHAAFRNLETVSVGQWFVCIVINLTIHIKMWSTWPFTLNST